MSELVLVRHGQASFGSDDYDRLSELGHRQVAILAAHWQQTGERFDAIYSGHLRRQQETAAALLPLLGSNAAQVNTHTGFNEYDGSPLINIYLREHATGDGLPASVEAIGGDRKLFQRVFEAATEKWLNDELEPTAADLGFEPWSAFTARVHAALDDLMGRYRNDARVLISTSGGVIAVALQKVLQLPPVQTINVNWMVSNSAVSRIRYGGGRLSLSQFNALPHLETASYQSLITCR